MVEAGKQKLCDLEHWLVTQLGIMKVQTIEQLFYKGVQKRKLHWL